MKTQMHTREQWICCNITDVLTYIAEVRNLPDWNNFFVVVGALEGDRWLVTTPQGLARTKLHVERGIGVNEVTISALINGQETKAHMKLASADGGTQVTFHLWLPEAMPEPRIDKALLGLETNLVQLADQLNAHRAG